MEHGTNCLSVHILRRRLFWWPLLSLIFLWSLLYLPSLRTSPPWYGDETGALILGRNLVTGSPTIGSLWLTYWHTYFPIQPGFLAVSGVFANIAGGDIVGARFLNTLFALTISLLIYFKGRLPLGSLPAWFGATIFLTFSQSVIHFRWIYPHDAVALGFTIAVLYLMRPSCSRNNWISGSGLAIAAGSHPLFVHGLIASFLCRLTRPSAWIRLALPPFTVIAATFAVVTWFYWPNHWLIQDLQNLAAFYRNSSATTSTGANLFLNFTRFYTQDGFHSATFVCLLLCLLGRTYPISLFGLSISVLLLQNRQNLPVFYYQAIVLAPVFGLAWAGAISKVAMVMRQWCTQKPFHRALFFVATLIPLSTALTQLPLVFEGRLVPRNQPWVTQNVHEVEAAASWVNENADRGALVVASSNIAWLLKTPNVDFFQVVLWSGNSTEYFLWGIGRERFRFPVEFSDIQYAIIGDIDQRWTLLQPNVDSIVRTFVEEKWPVVWQGQYYLILRNPLYKGAGALTLPDRPFQR